MSLFPIFLHSSYSHVHHFAVKGRLDIESTEPNVPATSKSALALEAAGRDEAGAEQLATAREMFTEMGIGPDVART